MPVLEVDALTVRYGAVEAVRALDLTVDEGQVVVVVGPNGAGKSSLMNAISGVVPLHGGHIRFRGKDITRTPAHRIARRGLVQVPEGRRIFAPLTVEENLLVGAYGTSGRSQKQDLARVEAMFPILAERRTSPAGLLSGGQQQMLAFGRALMARPHTMLIDEPSMGLSPAMLDQVITTIGAIAAEGISILMVEQNATAAFSVAHTVYVLEQGQVVLNGSVSEVSADPRVLEAFLGVNDHATTETESA